MRVIPHVRTYRGKDAVRRMRTDSFNELARRAAEHVNNDFSICGQEAKTYLFAALASELGSDEETMREALSDGGHNGITLFRNR